MTDNFLPAKGIVVWARITGSGTWPALVLRRTVYSSSHAWRVRVFGIHPKLPENEVDLSSSSLECFISHLHRYKHNSNPDAIKAAQQFLNSDASNCFQRAAFSHIVALPRKPRFNTTAKRPRGLSASPVPNNTVNRSMPMQTQDSHPSSISQASTSTVPSTRLITSVKQSSPEGNSNSFDRNVTKQSAQKITTTPRESFSHPTFPAFAQGSSIVTPTSNGKPAEPPNRSSAEDKKPIARNPSKAVALAPRPTPTLLPAFPQIVPLGPNLKNVNNPSVLHGPANPTLQCSPTLNLVSNQNSATAHLQRTQPSQKSISGLHQSGKPSADSPVLVGATSIRDSTNGTRNQDSMKTSALTGSPPEKSQGNSDSVVTQPHPIDDVSVVRESAESAPAFISASDQKHASAGPQTRVAASALPTASHKRPSDIASNQNSQNTSAQKSHSELNSADSNPENVKSNEPTQGDTKVVTGTLCTSQSSRIAPMGNGVMDSNEHALITAREELARALKKVELLEKGLPISEEMLNRCVQEMQTKANSVPTQVHVSHVNPSRQGGTNASRILGAPIRSEDSKNLLGESELDVVEKQKVISSECRGVSNDETDKMRSVHHEHAITEAVEEEILDEGNADEDKEMDSLDGKTFEQQCTLLEPGNNVNPKFVAEQVTRKPKLVMNLENRLLGTSRDAAEAPNSSNTRQSSDNENNVNLAEARNPIAFVAQNEKCDTDTVNQSAVTEPSLHETKNLNEKVSLGNGCPREMLKAPLMAQGGNLSEMENKPEGSKCIITGKENASENARIRMRNGGKSVPMVTDDVEVSKMTADTGNRISGDNGENKKLCQEVRADKKVVARIARMDFAIEPARQDKHIDMEVERRRSVITATSNTSTRNGAGGKMEEEKKQEAEKDEMEKFGRWMRVKIMMNGLDEEVVAAAKGRKVPLPIPAYESNRSEVLTIRKKYIPRAKRKQKNARSGVACEQVVKNGVAPVEKIVAAASISESIGKTSNLNTSPR